ncbi:MAG: hypothetical protein ACR2IK_01100 [Chloroflexota bacterium]
MSRIDSPVAGASLSPGPQVVAGIAYAGTRRIRSVEYSADDGQAWATAELLEPAPPGDDRWVRWRGTFTMPDTDTEVTLIARATDGDGDVQTSTFCLPEPWWRHRLAPGHSACCLTNGHSGCELATVARSQAPASGEDVVELPF